ncbi:MAG: sodium:solute symporter family protein, partial [Planctomycetes bacterium]|nr:sodium:solute symporter family protein [Planctomycetota bacterium]
QEGDKTVVYMPWQILLYMVAATTAGIVVSLFTQRVPEEKLNRFYELTRTPVETGEKIAEPCMLPESTSPSQRRMLLTAGGLEIPMPSVTSVVGFAVAWLCVAILIGGFIWIVS